MFKKFDNIKLDLFKIHDSKDSTKNWIFAKGEHLKIELGILINKTNFSNTELVKHLMKKLNISIASAERLIYLKKEWYPLIFIEELVNLTNSDKYQVQDKIEFSSKELMLEYARKLIKRKFGCNADYLLNSSKLLKNIKQQTKLEKFI